MIEGETAAGDERLRVTGGAPRRQGASMMRAPFERLEEVRFGFIGVGGRGSGQLHEVLGVPGVRITAVSDPVEAHALAARDRVVAAGGPAPVIEADWRRLAERDDVDLAYICSAWNDHVPQAVWAMECGKHAAVEVPAAVTIEGCWQLVDASERTRRHCIMLENTLYEWAEMLVLNAVRDGLLGTITHGEAAYIHDLRSLLLEGEGEGLWRRDPHIQRDGNLYPTHGLGPIARYMDIHRGDRFTRLVSMSSRPAALAEYRDRAIDANSPMRREVYRCGDMNVSLIHTALGRTVVLQHDVVTPRPYSRINLVAGTRGTFCDYPPRIYLDGQHEHDWMPLDALKERYEDPLWRDYGDLARKMGGHGGMDYILNLRLVQAFHRGEPPDMDVYDAAAWSAPGPLSDISVAAGSVPVEFPDFTRGGWRVGGSER